MENIKQHQEMGYDRSSGMFSPDGLILQVEYAEKAVQLGATVLALTTTQGVIFIGDRKIKSKLLVKESFKKVFEIDGHIGVTGAGAMSDGRRLIEESQSIAQKHRITYQDSMDILPLVKDVANIQQYYSQSGGLRPFGVSLLIGGMDDTKGTLYQTTPSGMYIRFLARSIGSLGNKINDLLEKKYTTNLDNKKAIKLGLELFKEVLEKEYDIERFDVAEVTSKGFKRLNPQKL